MPFGRKGQRWAGDIEMNHIKIRFEVANQIKLAQYEV
jgi:hypothetical protein